MTCSKDLESGISDDNLIVSASETGLHPHVETSQRVNCVFELLQSLLFVGFRATDEVSRLLNYILEELIVSVDQVHDDELVRLHVRVVFNKEGQTNDMLFIFTEGPLCRLRELISFSVQHLDELVRVANIMRDALDSEADSVDSVGVVLGDECLQGDDVRPGELLVVDVRGDDWVLKHSLRGNLSAFKRFLFGQLVKKHVGGKGTRVGQRQDVGVRSHAEGAHVALRVLSERGSSHADVLAFSQPTILQVVDLRVPDLSTVVNDSHLRLVLVDFEKLDHFNLQVKIEVFTVFFGANFWDVAQTGNELVGQHHLVNKVGS